MRGRAFNTYVSHIGMVSGDGRERDLPLTATDRARIAARREISTDFLMPYRRRDAGDQGLSANSAVRLRAKRKFEAQLAAAVEIYLSGEAEDEEV
jgi:hypothetical protein